MYGGKEKTNKMRYAVALFVCLLFFSLLIVSVEGDETGYEVKIIEVYVYSDPGSEYVVLENWGNDTSLRGWKLTNGRASVFLPDIVLEHGERLTLAEDEEGYFELWQRSPDHTWSDGDLERDGYFRLRDTGDDVILKKGDQVIDVFCYGDGEPVTEGWEGSRYGNLGRGEYAKRKSRDTDSVDDWSWTRTWRVGQSNFTTETITADQATLFVSPDTSLPVMIEFLENVEHNLVVSVYLLSQPTITDRIANLSQNNVDVRILVEGSPVGGMPDFVRRSLNKIKGNGGEVMVLRAGRYSPYNFFHCKYMIADNSSVLVSSENFVNTGYPDTGHKGNRGWGIVLNSTSLADYFTDVYIWDLHYAHEYVANDVTYTENEEKISYRSRYDHKQLQGNFTITPVLSPDSSMSENTILGMINHAEESIMVQQFYAYEWGYSENPYIKALIEAAKRGVEVKIMLDSTWYNLGGEWNHNDYTVDRLNNISSRKDIPLEARLLDPGHGMDKIHNKGMIVDRDTVLISSINWNSNSVLQNREAGLIVKGVGEYYAEVFMNDWRFDVIRPIADAGRNRDVEIGQLVRFDGTYSWDDNEIVSYRWDLVGDGVFETDGEVVSTVFREPGEYQVALRVEDGAGNVGIDSTVITVTEPEGSYMYLHEDASPTMIIILTSLAIATSTILYHRYRS